VFTPSLTFFRLRRALPRPRPRWLSLFDER
jgi:hypothetical protein